MTIARFEKAYGCKDVVCFWLHQSALAVCATFLAREPLYDPDIVNLDHHDELLPLRNSAPDFRAALARDPVDRGHNGTQKAVPRLGRWDSHLIKRKNRPITHDRYDGH